MTNEYCTAPVDESATVALEARNLHARVVDSSDADQHDPWMGAVRRGFLDGEPTDEQAKVSRELLAYRRKVGVYDAASVNPAEPVGTISAWPAQMSVPGEATVPTYAISSVTVSPTHRRKGIARALVMGELKVGKSLGFPVAALTVTESSIYERFGFGAATLSAHLVLDIKRATWTGPAPAGRLDFITRERFREVVPALHDAVRPGWPGEVDMRAAAWDALAGTRPDAKEAGKKRAVQYTDAAGQVRGAAIYTVQENDADYTKSKVNLLALLADGPDAYAALWRFFVEMDLIGTLTASELSVDEPLLFMIGDRRAATVTVVDHEYVRILDVTAALEARQYSAPGTVVLDVTDSEGLAGGRFVLSVDAEGNGTVTATDEPPAEAIHVGTGISELSSIYLGSVSLTTLVAAGRAKASNADAAARIFSWHAPARLSYWY